MIHNHNHNLINPSKAKHPKANQSNSNTMEKSYTLDMLNYNIENTEKYYKPFYEGLCNTVDINTCKIQVVKLIERIYHTLHEHCKCLYTAKESLCFIEEEELIAMYTKKYDNDMEYIIKYVLPKVAEIYYFLKNTEINESNCNILHEHYKLVVEKLHNGYSAGSCQNIIGVCFMNILVSEYDRIRSK